MDVKGVLTAPAAVGPLLSSGIISSDVMRAAIAYKWQAFGRVAWMAQLRTFTVFLVLLLGPAALLFGGPARMLFHGVTKIHANHRPKELRMLPGCPGGCWPGGWAAVVV